jgi:hypothetical protein
MMCSRATRRERELSNIHTSSQNGETSHHIHQLSVCSSRTQKRNPLLLLPRTVCKKSVICPAQRLTRAASHSSTFLTVQHALVRRRSDLPCGFVCRSGLPLAIPNDDGRGVPLVGTGARLCLEPRTATPTGDGSRLASVLRRAALRTAATAVLRSVLVPPKNLCRNN